MFSSISSLYNWYFDETTKTTNNNNTLVLFNNERFIKELQSIQLKKIDTATRQCKSRKKKFTLSCSGINPLQNELNNYTFKNKGVKTNASNKIYLPRHPVLRELLLTHSKNKLLYG